MSNFTDNQKESAGSNIRKEFALNNDHEVRELLNETEYAKYIEDLDNDRDLTFKDKNIMDYSENEIKSLSPEDKKKFRKLKQLQTQIKVKVVRHNLELNREKRNKYKEQQKAAQKERDELDKEIQNLLDQFQNSNEENKDDSNVDNKNFKRLYNKYKNKYLKLKEQLN